MGNAHMARLLLARGAEPSLRSIKSDSGKWTNTTPLHLAAMFRYSHDSDTCISALVAGGADLEAESLSGKTPLMLIKPTIANLELMRKLGSNLHAKYPDPLGEKRLGLDDAIMSAYLTMHPSPLGKISRQECGEALEWCRSNGVAVTATAERQFAQSENSSPGPDEGLPPGCPTS